MVKISIPTLGKDELEYVFKCMIEDDLSPNKYTDLFNNRIKKEIGLRYGAVLSSYLHAYDLIFDIIELKEGDEIIISSLSDAQILIPINRFRAVPVIIDVKKDSFIPSVEDIEKNITKKTKAIVLPQLFGIPHDLTVFRNFNIPVIEDCDGSFYSSIHDKKIGSFGDYVIVEFNDGAIVTAGGGAFVGSKNRKMGDYIKKLKENFNSGDIFMSNLNASVGLAQLKKLDKIVEYRKKIASFYDRAVLESRAVLIDRYDNQDIIFSKYIIKSETPFEEAKRLFNKYGVDIELAIKNPIYKILDYNPEDYKNSEVQYRKVFSVPFYPKLGKKDVETVIKCIKSIL